MHPLPHSAAAERPLAPAPPSAPVTPAARPRPSGPAEVSSSDPAARALARDCHATPWQLKPDAGLTLSPEELADARDIADRYRCPDDAESERKGEGSPCLEAHDTCRKQCRTTCLDCGKKCPPPCETCAAACPAADAGTCRLACGVAAAQCQKTCFRAREPCYDQCLDAYDACTRKTNDDWTRECGDCTAVLDCCSKKTADDHGVSCPEECWKGKVPAVCGQCDWYHP
jgi:hypothetical protein